MARLRTWKTGWAGALVLTFATLGLPACAAAEDPPVTLAPEFLALSLKEQNLAVYEAFWSQIESNYYVENYFATDEWRSRRAQWREKVAAQTQIPFRTNVLRELLALMPESHFDLSYPTTVPKSESPPSSDYDWNRMWRLVGLMNVGPGIDTVEVRRGNRKFYLVGDVFQGTLAEEAGIRPGWRVIESASSTSYQDNSARYIGVFVPLDAAAARSWERGESPDAPIPEANIVRIKVDLRPRKLIQPFETRRLAGGVRYLRFDGFGDADFMHPVYRAVANAGPAGLIIDLRWNIGGGLEPMRQVAGALLGADAFLGTSLSRKANEAQRATGEQRHYTGPLILLVGPRSASGAEILAAAVQDHERGWLVGRLTNGSVLGAKQFPLPDSSYVTVPALNWLRAGDRRIEGIGVEPDVWLLPTLEDIRAGRDPVLERALRELSKPASTS